jgi:hypothetical protein
VIKRLTLYRNGQLGPGIENRRSIQFRREAGAIVATLSSEGHEAAAIAFTVVPPHDGGDFDRYALASHLIACRQPQALGRFPVGQGIMFDLRSNTFTDSDHVYLFSLAPRQSQIIAHLHMMGGYGNVPLQKLILAIDGKGAGAGRINTVMAQVAQARAAASGLFPGGLIAGDSSGYWLNGARDG